MDDNSNTQLDPASDSKAKAELAKLCKERRQPPPKAPSLLADYLAGKTFDAASPAEIAATEAADAEAEKRRRAYEIRGRANAFVETVGERYRHCTLESFEISNSAQREVVAVVREHISTDSRDPLIFYGPCGTGKDHLAVCVGKAAIKAGRTVGWVSAQSWFGKVRDAMDSTTSEASLIAELTRPDVLCISDPLPPVGQLTPHQATMLYRCVDGRYSKGLPTIVTVNVADDSEADARMGAAVWDRLCHGAWKLCCNWPSHRKPKRVVGGVSRVPDRVANRVRQFETNGKH